MFRNFAKLPHRVGFCSGLPPGHADGTANSRRAAAKTELSRAAASRTTDRTVSAGQQTRTRAQDAVDDFGKAAGRFREQIEGRAPATHDDLVANGDAVYLYAAPRETDSRAAAFTRARRDPDYVISSPGWRLWRRRGSFG